MGLFSFLFHRKPSETQADPRSADLTEKVSDATMFLPRVDLPSTEDSAPPADDDSALLDEISSAVQDKLNHTANDAEEQIPTTEAADEPVTESAEESAEEPSAEAEASEAPVTEEPVPTTEASDEPVTESAEESAEEPSAEAEASEVPAEAPVTEEQIPTAEAADEPVTKTAEESVEEPSAEAEASEAPAEAPVTEEPADESVMKIALEPVQDDAVLRIVEEADVRTSADWGTHLEETSDKRSKPSMPSFDDECFRLVWKLKGTGKKRRLKVIAECTKGQPVFIICDSNGKNCIVITEDGEEIGKLSDQDTTVYHNMVAGTPHNMYIQKINAKEYQKIGVKILVIVRKKHPDSLR